MDDARRLIAEGNTTTSIIVADFQTAGRGRHNRPWLTFPAPHGMAATFILRPAVGPHLPLIAAIALHQALTQHSTLNTQHLKIKWPNDILLNSQKLAGILCENIGQTASLIGIGLNIYPPAEVPPNFQGTFLTSRNPKTPTPQSLASAIMACLNPLVALYEKNGWTESLHNSYVQHCATIGKIVRWRVPQEGSGSAENKELTGLARGLTPNGHLELVDGNGTVHVIHSGEIFDKRPS